MKKIYESLKSSPLFAGINGHDFEKMLSCFSANYKKYGKGGIILLSGDKITDVGIVLSGSIQIIREDFWGNRTIISKLQKGELFGETFACADIDKSPITVEAAEECEILFIGLKRILHSCSSACAFHTKIIENFLRIMAVKNLYLNNKLDIISQRTTREKLMVYLTKQTEKSGKNDFLIPFSRNELADFLCVDRSALSRELGKMRDEGIVDYNKNRFKLLV